MVFMKIKEILGKVLMVLSVSMIRFSPASCASVGVEEMPESMKNLR
jgi:hypothetical protein